MPLKDFTILKNATIALCDIFELQGFQNISVTNDADYIELSLNHSDKFPALIVTGPELVHNSFTKGQGLYSNIIEKDFDTMTYTERKPPQIVNVIYNLIILGATDQEVMNAVLNVYAIFNNETRINIENNEYRIYLIEHPEINNETNDSELVMANFSVQIEGIEIYTDDTITTGNLSDNIVINPAIKNN